MRYLTKILVLTACLIALSGVAAACECGTNEYKSLGYWKNHPDEWPGKCITIGCTTYYKCPTAGQLSYQDAIGTMQQPVKGDKTYTLFDALIAAKLNKANGCCAPCDVEEAINGADCLIKIYLKNGTVLKANSPEWQGWTDKCGCEHYGGEYYYEVLDAYNNGQL